MRICCCCHAAWVTVLVMALAGCGSDSEGEPAQEGTPCSLGQDLSQAQTVTYGPLEVQQLELGSPTWEVVDWTVFSADTGSLEEGFEGVFAILGTVLAQHKNYQASGPGPDPDQPHAPPYATELSEGVAAAGYTAQASFAVADWTSPRSLIVGSTIVPRTGAPVGASPDFASGPLLASCDGRGETDGDCPGELRFDAQFETEICKDDVVIDGSSYPYPQLGELGSVDNPDEQPPEGDSFSHAFIFLLEGTAFVDGVAGTYSYRVRAVEPDGDGWLSVFTIPIE